LLKFEIANNHQDCSLEGSAQTIWKASCLTPDSISALGVFPAKQPYFHAVYQSPESKISFVIKRNLLKISS
jgi:hypothetical protein